MVLLDENGELITTAESGLGKDFLPMVERLKRRELTECARKALSQSDVVVTENPLSTCTGCPLAKMYAGRGAMTVRLEYGGKAYGLLSVSLPRDFARDEEEQSLFKDVANDIAMALHSIESEEKRKRAEQALLESEGHFRKLFEQSIDAIFIHQSSRIIDVNNRACEMLGYSKNHLLTMAIEDLHPEEDRPESRRKVDTAHRVESILFETQFTKADGTMVDVEVNSRIIDHERKIIQGIARDITERKQAEETNKKLQTQLQQSQKLESIGRLAGGVAHDFNNILTVIIGNAELLSISLGKDNPLQGRVEEISKGGERAASLTRQLLAFSRRQMLQPQVLDLNSVIPNMDKMLRRLIGEDIDLETVLAPDLGSVEADPGQIEQVIMNLAVNARDAMPTGGKLTIETANVDLDKTYASKHIAVKPGPYVMMAISDTGTGMDEETRSNIFEPFFTTKEKGKGTGLGLSTVYGIVKQSGGNIWVYSEPEKGTTLKIYLPRVEKIAETAEKVKATAESLTGSETIMVAEDDKMVRDMARSILQQYGYSVLDAEDGESAIRLSEKYEGDVHLMLTDVVMPGMSGRVLAERLAGKRPKMKVLYMSGYTDNAIVHHGVLGKDMNFLQKPFTVEALVKKVREVLDS
jgi:PAS domain S-box-containing protein